MIRMTIKRTQTPAVKELVGLMGDSERQNGTAMIYVCGEKQTLARDVAGCICALVYTWYTHAGGVAADKARVSKCTKYITLEGKDTFCPISIEAGSKCNDSAIELAQEIGKSIAEEARETDFRPVLTPIKGDYRILLSHISNQLEVHFITTPLTH